MSSMPNSQAVSGANLAAIVALMILPLPLFLLDSLLAINISLGVILVLMAIYVNSPIQVGAVDCYHSHDIAQR